MIPEYPVTRIFTQLGKNNLLPAILFRTSRRQCDADVVRIARYRGAILPYEEQERLRQEVSKLIEDFRLERAVIEGHSQYAALISTAIGAHHAGQLLMWRLLLEEMMSRGLLRIMVATGTVAAGVDFPARTVVVTAHSRRGSEGFRSLTASELQQMSGRAGRRGKDAVGICLVAPGPFSDARVLYEVAKQPPEPLRSAYFAAPATILNLLKFRSVDDLRYTVHRSLASFIDRKNAGHILKEAADIEHFLNTAEGKRLGAEQRKKNEKRARRREREAEALEKRQQDSLEKMLRGLETLGFVVQGSLTEKGLWAAHLCTNLVLELAESISDFLFEDLTVEQVVGLVAAIAGDPHRAYVSIRQNPIPKEAYHKLEAVVQRVRSAFEEPPNKGLEVLPDAAVTVISWMEASSWAEYSGLLRLAGVSEGDASRLIMQTGEHLGQMARLVDTHPDIAHAAAEGRRMLLKPPLTESLVD